MNALTAEDLAVDRQLANVASSFRFLLDVSPVNLHDARERFLGGHEFEFEYRPLDDDPDIVRTQLSNVDCSAVDDPIAASLFEDRRRELELQVDMLDARCSSDFLPLSIEMYGAVTPRLVDEATSLLDQLEAEPSQDFVDAEDFSDHVERELEWYRQIDSDFGVHVDIRDDIGSVMVAEERVLVPASARIPVERIDALIQHEVGTHALTHVNGSRQPLRMLADGIAGYEATQEGLAVFVEYLVGGLTPQRLRTLAGRVIAVHLVTEGASFDECFVALHLDHRFSKGKAFATTARVYRGGGLTKDGVYLRGLLDVLAHVAAGHSLEPLWLGKLSLPALPLMIELWERGALEDPALTPSFFERPDVTDRIDCCTPETVALDLVRRPK